MADGVLGGGDKKAAEEKAPYSIEAEQAVLGAVLFDNEVLNRVSGFLKAEHFYDPVHRLIYEAAGTLVQSGRVASPTIVDSYLSTSLGYREAGGVAYLKKLAAAVPSIVGAHDYGRLVFDMATRRGLMSIGAGMIERARDASLDDEPGQQLQDAEQALFSLAETGKYGTGFKPFHDSIKQAIDIANAAVARGGGLAGVATGFDDLDNKMGGLHPSDLIILAGRPSMGKSSLATCIAVNAARRHRTEIGENGLPKTVEGAVVGFFSLEMSAEQLATRIISEATRVPSELIRRGDLDIEAFRKIHEESLRLEALPIFIDDTGGLSISQIAARARRLKRQYGLDLLVIDYLQLITASSRKGDNRVQEITEISQGLKTLAKELDVPIVALSQLSRQVESREDKRPQLQDLRESGSIEQDADIVLFVYREDYYLRRAEPRVDSPEHLEWQQKCHEAHGVAEVIIGKQRHGPIGKVELLFEEQFTRFANLERRNYDGRQLN